MHQNWRELEPLTHIPQDKLAIGSWVWGRDYYHGRFSLLDLPKKAASLGIHQIECNDFILPPPRLSRVTRPFYSLIPHVNPDLWRYRTTTLHTLKKLLDKHNQTCLCWALNTDFTRPPIGQLASRLYWWWGAQAIDILHPKIVRIIAGGTQCTPISQQMVTRTAACVRYFLQRSSVEQVVLENHWGASSQISQHVQLYKSVQEHLNETEKSGWGLCLDPFNLESDHPEKEWQLMAPHTKHVHLKLGRDHGRLLEILHDVGYTGSFTVEEIPHS